MAYATSNPPKLVCPSFTDGTNHCSIWSYSSDDAATVVRVTGYITNGGDLGMKVGDIVLGTDADASPPALSVYRVVTVSATAPGAVDLADAVALGSTNTD